ncbi:MAG: TonB family protein [Calditrichaeota bacterium]|nr:TonB family protein [Calditrichota bacterium]
MADGRDRKFRDALSRYEARLERAVVATLVLLIVFFVAFKEVRVQRQKPAPVAIRALTVEEVPATRQGSRRPPPRRPAVPIPSESEDLPEDETIEETTLQEGSGERASQGSSEGVGGEVFYLPRTIRDVIPEYPEKLRGKVKGVVKLMLEVGPDGRVRKVLVVENSTGSPVLEKAAVKAARQCLFWPPRDAKGRPVSVWVPKLYRFE